MLKKDLVEIIQRKLKVRTDAPCIDNWVFKLHYAITSPIFFICTVLVTSREYIGEHIRCISDSDKKEFQKVIDSFCFFKTTFTVINPHEMDFFDLRSLSLPGVMPYLVNSRQTIRRHMYYQWVPFALFGQMIVFYVTHIMWKSFENGRIRKMIAGLEYSSFSLLEQEVEVEGHKIPTKMKKKELIKKIKTDFLQRISLNKSWARCLIFLEILNVFNVAFQIFITNKFLGNQFYTLGIDLMNNGTSVLDDVFPKLTKCTFHKYGHSGTIQIHDALCVMALNIINEKIYAFLWFWFVILFTISSLNLIWRLLTMFLYSRSVVFNRMLFDYPTNSHVRPWNRNTILSTWSYADWLLLKYLSKNMNGFDFRELFDNICEDIEERNCNARYETDSDGKED